MGYVYRYTDLSDGIIKYIGIIWSENRTIIQRIQEHYLYDDWCKNKRWKIEYIVIDNKTDCEGLEGHFISLYNTGKWYNKSKVKWGISKIYSMINWEWIELEYNAEKFVSDCKRKQRKINNDYLDKLYNKSIYIFNNGSFYCFFESFKKEPEYVYMALNSEAIDFALENNIRFMTKDQLDRLVQMINNDNKNFGYSILPSEKEQILLETGLTIQQCYTFKKRQRMLDDFKLSYPTGIAINYSMIAKIIEQQIYCCEISMDDIRKIC